MVLILLSMQLFVEVSAVLTEHLNATLKAKNSLGSFLDKMKAVAAGDKDCDATLV